MQAIKLEAEIENLVSDLVSRVVYASPKHIVYEVSNESIAQWCMRRLDSFNALTISKEGRWFVSVFL